MKKKRNIILAISFTLFIVVYLILFMKPVLIKYKNTDTLMNKIGSKMFEFNKIFVNVNDTIEINDFVIKNNSKIVYKLGKQRNKLDNNYGRLKFEIYYKDSLVSEIGHSKRNNWYTNDYYFNIRINHGEINIKCNFEGPDGMNLFYKKDFIRNDIGSLVLIEYFDKNDSLYYSKIIE